MPVQLTNLVDHAQDLSSILTCKAQAPMHPVFQLAQAGGPHLSSKRLLLSFSAVHMRGPFRSRHHTACLQPLPAACCRSSHEFVGCCPPDRWWPVEQALCTEAALAALRRRFPQIYASQERLLVEPSQVCVHRPDFLAALGGMTPAAHRSATTHARWGFTSDQAMMLLYMLRLVWDVL